MIRTVSFLLLAVFVLAGCAKQSDIGDYVPRTDMALDGLVENLTGDFVAADAGLKFRTARLTDAKRAIYVEVTDSSNHELVYSGVWKFFNVNGEPEMQFWRITEPERFRGAVDDEDLRNTIWMYHLRELDGCRLVINIEPEIGSETGQKDSDLLRKFELTNQTSECYTDGEPFQLMMIVDQNDMGESFTWTTGSGVSAQMVTFTRSEPANHSGI